MIDGFMDQLNDLKHPDWFSGSHGLHENIRL